MGTFKRDNKGFGIVELLLVIVIIVLLGVVGWFVYKNHNKTTITKAATNTTTSNPYQGWKTGTLKYDQITYKYPPAWILTGSSTASPQSSNGCVYPGTDSYTLTSPSGNTLSFRTGFSCGGGASGVYDFSSSPISLLGQTLYLDILSSSSYSEGDTAPSQVGQATISNSTYSNGSAVGALQSFTDKNIFIPGNTSSPSGPASDIFNFWLKQPEPLSNFNSDPDFLATKLIFESMKYTN
ncbi:MAG TPA: hypothetical protein VMQ58_02145 [Candidatus Saccharimonadales bacterium]|jgi:hypothetical protein|nr:hypothetical protein [Candidatus Saccharimonadales bacterium]